MRLTALLTSLLLPAVVASGPAGKTAGPNTAPLTVEIYSDFECPSCKVFHETGLRSLLNDYVVPGKIYIIHREFPLPMHKHSRTAAAWATAAAHVGKYDDVANALFARQTEWTANGNVAEVASSVLSPEQAKKARALAADPAIAAEVQRDLQIGLAAGVNSTPTFIITRKLKRYPISGSLNYNLLRRLLDDLLKQ